MENIDTVKYFAFNIYSVNMCWINLFYCMLWILFLLSLSATPPSLPICSHVPVSAKDF